MRPCNSPSEPPPSPWLRLKALSDDLHAQPDTPIEPLQNLFADFKLEFLDIMILVTDVDIYKVPWRSLELADMSSASSMQTAAKEVLGLMP